MYQKLEEPTYPKLVSTRDESIVIMLVNESTGMVVHSEDGNYPLGEYGNNWNIYLMKDYTGTIELTNSCNAHSNSK